MKKVLILLSTYNGEKYLKEQFDSLFKQKGVDVTILIRDDGSDDGTISIIEDYSKKYLQIKLIKGVNCGACNSFLKLMHEGLKYLDSYDYFAFCDQDDVWLEDKLISAINILENNAYVGIPKLYMSAYQMADTNLNPINTYHRSPKHSLPAAIASNCATGCTMVFNASLLKDAVTYDTTDVLMHDYWTYLVCLVRHGFVFYDPVPHILYRQHEDNVIGGLGDSFGKRWYLRIQKLFRPADSFKSKLARKLLLEYESLMNENDKEFLEKMSTPKRISSKIYLMRCKDFWSGSSDCNRKNRGLLITGKI